VDARLRRMLGAAAIGAMVMGGLLGAACGDDDDLGDDLQDGIEDFDTDGTDGNGGDTDGTDGGLDEGLPTPAGE
jgi:hypothetical protein